MKTKVICLEGVTGAGKTTQASKISELLNFKGKNNIVVNEKQYEPFKQTVINWHNSGADLDFSYEDILKFAKARAEIHRIHFKPLLGELEYVIFDRSFYTSGIYQASNSLCPEEIIEINLKEGAIKPEEGLVLLCSPQTALERTEKRRKGINLYELPSINETLEEIIKRRELYLQLSVNHPELYLIHAEKDEDEVFREIKEKLEL
jgi:dTMP kinase